MKIVKTAADVRQKRAKRSLSRRRPERVENGGSAGVKIYCKFLYKVFKKRDSSGALTGGGHEGRFRGRRIGGRPKSSIPIRQHEVQTTDRSHDDNDDDGDDDEDDHGDDHDDGDDDADDDDAVMATRLTMKMMAMATMTTMRRR